jgi:hypothetical protein
MLTRTSPALEDETSQFFSSITMSARMLPSWPIKRNNGCKDALEKTCVGQLAFLAVSISNYCRQASARLAHRHTMTSLSAL